MIYQHPLAYLLGLQGLALLRAWAGLAEVRRLLDNEELANHAGVMVRRGDTLTGYQQWSASYDEPRNTLFDADEPVVHSILDSLPAGLALDAACGTGRYTADPADLGHRVIARAGDGRVRAVLLPGGHGRQGTRPGGRAGARGHVGPGRSSERGRGLG